jgi:hypothetical protein
VSKLSNGDIEILIRQWLMEKPVLEIARNFQITCQRVHSITTRAVPVMVLSFGSDDPHQNYQRCQVYRFESRIVRDFHFDSPM